MFKPVLTADGSSTFYSDTYREWFHSRDGACYEAKETYIRSVQLAQRVRDLPTGQPFKILDVCYGLGYNTAAALEAIWQVNPDCAVDVKALEIDIEVARSAITQNLTQHYSSSVQKMLSAIASHLRARHNNTDVQLLLGDARQQIQTLVAQEWQADIIFLDPFSPPHCPQLWTTEFLSLVAQCLMLDSGALVTYSCAAAVRSALLQAGLSIGSLQTSARRWPGTIARYLDKEDCTVRLPPLSQQEEEHLKTKAAVPYRDPNLRDGSKEIIKRREKEQRESDLLPTGPWRSRWKQNSLSNVKVQIKEEN